MGHYDNKDFVDTHLLRHRPLSQLLNAVLATSCVKLPASLKTKGDRGGDEIGYRWSWHWEALRVGRFMEETAELLKAINVEVSESKARMQEMANDVKALADIVNPALAQQANSLRTARMSVVSEVNQSLGALKDVRKFFFESTYEEEMSRLERFVRICRDIQELKESGVFDAVCDAAIKLAVKESK